MRLTVKIGCYDCVKDQDHQLPVFFDFQDRNIDFYNKLKYLFSLPAPYDIKNGIRLIRGTHKLVSETTEIYCLRRLRSGVSTKMPEALGNNKFKFSSISECSKALKIDRSTIKKYLITGEFFNNYKFSLTP